MTTPTPGGMLVSDPTQRPHVARYTHEPGPIAIGRPRSGSLFALCSPITRCSPRCRCSIPATRRGGFWKRLAHRWWAGSGIRFSLSGAERKAPVAWALAQQLAAILVAIAMAMLWSLASRRTEYDRLAGWSRIVLRYYVGVVMMVYGAFKVIPSQFPPLALDQLAQPLGSLTPMGLLWSYMGYSSVYTVFAGLGESVGGFLLFFRRTTTAGALILVAVLSNVALINYAYDVPVKQLSTNLLLASMLLAAADARRLIAVFALNAATMPADQTFAFRPKTLRVRRWLKPAVIGLATIGPFAGSFFVHANLVRRPPLYGVYRVEHFGEMARSFRRWRWTRRGGGGSRSPGRERCRSR